jgi:hypothetical protein
MVGMSSIAPRRICEHCGRSIAVVAGKLARHDPSDRGPILLSCDGSLQPAPMLQEPDRSGTHSLFELVAQYAAAEFARRGVPAQDVLFEAPPLAA